MVVLLYVANDSAGKILYLLQFFYVFAARVGPYRRTVQEFTHDQ
jgi:hypothetical protein